MQKGHGRSAMQTKAHGIATLAGNAIAIHQKKEMAHQEVSESIFKARNVRSSTFDRQCREPSPSRTPLLGTVLIQIH